MEIVVLLIVLLGLVVVLLLTLRFWQRQIQVDTERTLIDLAKQERQRQRE